MAQVLRQAYPTQDRITKPESGPIFTFHLGNTPERKDYIMDKLVVPVKE